MVRHQGDHHIQVGKYFAYIITINFYDPWKTLPKRSVYRKKIHKEDFNETLAEQKKSPDYGAT